MSSQSLALALSSPLRLRCPSDPEAPRSWPAARRTARWLDPGSQKLPDRGCEYDRLGCGAWDSALSVREPRTWGTRPDSLRGSEGMTAVRTAHLHCTFP